MGKRRNSANNGRRASWNTPSKKRQMSAPQKALATRRQGHNDTADALQQPAPDQAALPPGSTSAVVSGQPPAPNAIRVIDVRDREAWRKSYYGTIGYRVVTGAEWLQLMLPQLMTVLVILILIFGGCCSNALTLEAIISPEPESGFLITLVQFVFVAAVGWHDHFSVRHPPFFLKPNRVPLRRWFGYVFLFGAVNVLNNYALGFHISVPVHIILRSGGSVATMAIGWLWGTKYSRRQVEAVALLTLGVAVAAIADADAKGRMSSGVSSSHALTTFVTGLAILFIAQVLTAIMGLYTQRTYELYGRHWRENLFYSHAMSLPFFFVFSHSLRRQFDILLASPPVFSSFPRTASGDPHLKLQQQQQQQQQQQRHDLTAFSSPVERFLAAHLSPPLLQSLQSSFNPPQLVLAAVVNAMTQYACIRGVNRLAARSSALTVTIVLNVRKLVSLLLSIWLFGNSLSVGVLVGATLVFGSGALYAREGQRAKHKAVVEDKKHDD